MIADTLICNAQAAITAKSPVLCIFHYRRFVFPETFLLRRTGIPMEDPCSGSYPDDILLPIFDIGLLSCGPDLPVCTVELRSVCP